MAQIINFPLAYYPSVEAANEDLINADSLFEYAKERYIKDHSELEFYRYARDRLHLAQGIRDYVYNEHLINRGKIS